MKIFYVWNGKFYEKKALTSEQLSELIKTNTNIMNMAGDLVTSEDLEF